jgi:glycosyltransferase involved in cell wall biosynthesis
MDDYSDLTIAIPTYNRSRYLKRCLEHLQACRLNGARILVIDNFSSDDTPLVLRQFESASLQGTLRFVRNAANIGGDANILRCFELATTKWLWIVGDDDKPLPNSVDCIMHEVSRQSKCVYLNFSTSILQLRVTRCNSFSTFGLADFVERLDCYSNILFITAGVYQREVFVPYLSRAYPFIFAHSAHLALLLIGLGELVDMQCFFSASKIADWEPPAAEIAWDHDNFISRCPFVVQAIASSRLRCIMLSKIAKVEDIAPALSIQSLLLGFGQDPGHVKISARRYLILFSITMHFKRAVVCAFLVMYLSRLSLFRWMVWCLVELSKRPIPVFGKYINIVVSKELLQPSLLRASG